MKIAIIGVGAMGCLFAAALTPLANTVMLGHWSEQVATLQTQGLTVQQLDGRHTHHPVQVTNNPKQISSANLALILVKSHQTKRAAQGARQILAPNGVALTLQNGLGNWETIAEVIGKKHTLLGVTAQGATLQAPGLVRHAGNGLTHLLNTPYTAAIASLFQEAGITTHLVDDVQSLVWGKLAVNAGINPLTALLGVPNGFLAQNKQARQIMSQAARETAVIAQALSIQLPYTHAAQRALEVAQVTATNHSSMLQDIRRGAPTEIEAICGAIVNYGRQLQIPTPVNTHLLHLIHQLETGDSSPTLNTIWQALHPHLSQAT